jgi:hypothetical protein
MNFGIMVVDMSKYVTKETYRLEMSFTSVSVDNVNIYASTSQKILTSTLNKNLLDPNNWKEYPIKTTAFTSSEVKKLLFFDGKLNYLIKNKGLY